MLTSDGYLFYQQFARLSCAQYVGTCMNYIIYPRCEKKYNIAFFDRVMAAAASATFGRLGSLIANIIFGLLIDSHCILLIIIFSSLLISKYPNLTSQ